MEPYEDLISTELGIPERRARGLETVLEGRKIISAECVIDNPETDDIIMLELELEGGYILRVVGTEEHPLYLALSRDDGEDD